MTKPRSESATNSSPETPTGRVLKAPPTKRAGVDIPAAVLAALDFVVLTALGRPLVIAVPFSIVLGLFIWYFLGRKHQVMSERYRRENGLADADGTTPAPRGGWANPTAGQRALKRFGPSSLFGKNRPR
jgi:hypothetical protein